MLENDTEGSSFKPGFVFHCPIDFTENTIKALAGLITRSPDELLVYGSLPHEFPSGRPNDVPNVGRIDVERTFKSAFRYGIHTKYLLNGILQDVAIRDNHDYIKWVAECLEPDLISVSDRGLTIKLCREFSCRNIAVSTISGWLTKNDAHSWLVESNLSECIQRVSLHHDFVMGGKSAAIDFVEFLHEKGVEPDVLVTESCKSCCSSRTDHYSLFASRWQTMWTPSFVDYFQISCVLDRLLKPETLLDLAGFLPPSRIDSYSNTTGITNFKISGRSMPSAWVQNCLQHYLAREDPKNIFEIIVFTTPQLSTFGMSSSDLFWLSSDAYQEIYNEHWSDQKSMLEHEGWLQAKTVKFFLDGRLKVNDPGCEYVVEDGAVKCIKLGEYASFLRKKLGAATK